MAGRPTSQARRRIVSAPSLVVVGVAAWACHAQAQTLQDKIAACPACHGETGQSANPDIPSIGGQPKLFVMYQLFFYREGRRENVEMNTVTKGMSDGDLEAISAHVAGLPPPPSADGPIDEGRYRRGAAT